MARLAELRVASGKSFARLARELDRPRSTIHGWCTGHHLPFPRDDDVFGRLVVELGVDDPAPWVDALRRVRRRNDRSAGNPYLGLEPFTEADAGRLHGRRALVDRLVATTCARAEVPCVVIGASGAGKTSLLRAGLLAGLAPPVRGHYLTPGPRPSDRLDALGAELTSEPTLGDVVVIDQFEELFTLAAAEAIGPTMAAIEDLQRRPSCEVVIGVRADFYHRLLDTPLLAAALGTRQVVVGPMSPSEVTDAIVEPAAAAGMTLAPDLVTELLRSFTSGPTTGSPLPLLSHVLYLMAERATGNRLTLADYEAIGGLTHALERSAEEAHGALPLTARALCREVLTALVELGQDATPTRRPAGRAELATFGSDADVVIEELVRRRLLTVDHETVQLCHEAIIAAWPRLAAWVDDRRDTLRAARRIRLAHESWVATGHDPAALLRGTALDDALAVVSQPRGAPLDAELARFVERSEATRRLEHRADAERLARQLAMHSAVLDHHDASLARHLAVVAHTVAVTPESRSAVLRASRSIAGPRFVGSQGPVVLATSPAHGRAVTVHQYDGQITGLGASDGTLTRDHVWVCGAMTGAFGATLTRDAAWLAVATRHGDVIVARSDGSGASSPLPEAERTGAPVLTVASDPHDDRILAGTEDGLVRSWRRLGDRWTPDAMTACGAAVLDIAVHPGDGSLLVALGDGRVEWRPGVDDRVTWAVRAPAGTAASAVGIGPDGRHLAAGFHDGRVRIWSLGSGRPREVEVGSAPFATWVNVVGFSPDGELFVAASSDGTVRLWEVATWREIRPELRHPAVVSDARFAGARLLVTASEDGIVRTWDLARAVTGSDESVWSIDVDATGASLIVASRSMVTTVGVVDPDEPSWQLDAPVDGELFSGETTVAGDRLLIGTRVGSVLAVAPGDALPPRPLGEHGVLGALVEGLSAGVDGSPVVAVGANGRTRCWWFGADGRIDATADRTVASGPALACTIDRTSSIVAIATEPGEVVLLDVSSPGALSEVARFATATGSRSASPTTRLAPGSPIGGADREVSLWDLGDPTAPAEVARIHGPAGQVMAVAFDGSGDRLAAGATDGSLWLWDLRRGDTTECPPVPALWASIATGEAGVYALAFAPDGHHLVSAGPRRRVMWWPLDDERAIELVRDRGGDPLTESERHRYVPDTVQTEPVHSARDLPMARRERTSS